MEIEKLKNYLKVDVSDDDDLISDLYSTASQYILESIDAQATEASFKDYRLFEQSVILLTKQWYENRSATTQSAGITATSQSDIAYGILPLIQKLRGYYFGH